MVLIAQKSGAPREQNRQKKTATSEFLITCRSNRCDNFAPVGEGAVVSQHVSRTTQLTSTWGTSGLNGS